MFDEVTFLQKSYGQSRENILPGHNPIEVASLSSQVMILHCYSILVLIVVKVKFNLSFIYLKELPRPNQILTLLNPYMRGVWLWFAIFL